MEGQGDIMVFKKDTYDRFDGNFRMMEEEVNHT